MTGPPEMGYCDNDCCQETVPLGSEHCRGYPVIPFDDFDDEADERRQALDDLAAESRRLGLAR